MNPPLCIVILSCWRSGTSWLEGMLGKRIAGSTMFGHEQQLFPLLSMMHQCWGKCPASIRKLANKPLCDIDDDFHHQIGVKLNKVLSNTRKCGDGDFNKFAAAFIDTLLAQYQEYQQVVCKSPENLSPGSFDAALDILSNRPNFNLVYLYRRFEPYLASCFIKFDESEHTLNYYADKYISWHLNAMERLKGSKPSNLFVLNYDDLATDPTIAKKFSILLEIDPKIRAGTTNKWESSKAIGVINKLASRNSQKLGRIANFVNNVKIRDSV